jgi:hypothetical protein
MTFLSKTWIYLKKSAKGFGEHPYFTTATALIQYFPVWIKHLSQGRNSVSDKMPWLTFSSINFIEKIIEPQMTVFEYGSGGSTLFWASRVKKVISVEHDKEWYEKMKAELSTRKIENVDYLLLQEECDTEYDKKDFRNPHHYISADPKYSGSSFKRYARSIDNYNAQGFDIIVIDGRARPSCLLHAIQMIKMKGFIIIDNTERTYYLESFNLDGKQWRKWDFFGPVPYSFDFANTTVLKKL